MYFVYDRRHIANETTCAPVELKIYFKRAEGKIINSGIKVLPCQWNGEIVNHPDAIELNKKLADLRKKFENIIIAMQVDNKPVSLESLNEYINPGKKAESIKNFIDFAKEEMYKSTIRDTTKKQHLVAIQALEKFGRIKSFASLTLQNIEAFDIFLRRENPNRSQATIHGYHKRIKPYVNKAYRLGYIDINPYERFTDTRGISKEIQPLTQKELNDLQAIDLPNKLDNVRDLFIFSCYTGLAYADTQIFNFQKEAVKDKGIYWIDAKRYKTGIEFYTPILPPAMKVLKKYNFKLPHLSNQKYNDYLHVIEARMNLRKSLTSHVARHTFATTVALAHDVPIETVSKMLGHKDIKTTQIYAKVLKSTIERNVIQKML